MPLRLHKHYPATPILHPCILFVYDSLHKDLTFKLTHLSLSFVKSSISSSHIQKFVGLTHLSVLQQVNPFAKDLPDLCPKAARLTSFENHSLPSLCECNGNKFFCANFYLSTIFIPTQHLQQK